MSEVWERPVSRGVLHARITTREAHEDDVLAKAGNVGELIAVVAYGEGDNPITQRYTSLDIARRVLARRGFTRRTEIEDEPASNA